MESHPQRGSPTQLPPPPSPSLSDDDPFDRLPDPLLLLILNNLADVKALGRCSLVSRRFHDLSLQVHTVLVRVDCVISDADHLNSSPSPSSISSSPDKSCGVLSHIARLVITGIVRPIQALGQILGSTPDSPPGAGPSSPNSSEVSHHSPTEVLRNFREIRRLTIELPAGELSVDDGVLLKWKARFGSTLDSCVILGAFSAVPADVEPSGEDAIRIADGCGEVEGGEWEDNGIIPESFYTNGSLKLRVVWTISSLIAASARHYLLQPIIAEHGTLERLDLTDADGQGVLCMEREQLEEMRVKPLAASGSSQRTLVPALNMKLWYAGRLELPGGLVLKGATLVAIRPSEQKETGGSDGSWIVGSFEEPYRTAASLLLRRKTYCLEMNSF